MKNLFAPVGRYMSRSYRYIARKDARMLWVGLVVIVATLLGFVYVAPDAYNTVAKKLHLPEVAVHPYSLGLDLAGGAHLVYEADTSNIPPSQQDEAMAGVRDVIERRVNAFGVSEPLVQTTKSGSVWRLVVELAGIKDVNQAIKMIGETPILEFKEQNTVTTRRPLTAEEQKELKDTNAKAEADAKALGVELSRKKGVDFEAIVRDKSQDATTRDKGGDIGFVGVQNQQFSSLYEFAQKQGVGAVSTTPIRSADGFNIVQVVEERPGAQEIAARHILICYKGAASCTSELSKEDAQKKAQELRDKATPANFEQLAKENSTEPGAAQRGGDLGWFTLETMVKPFADAAFALKKGDISPVVETQFGFHVILKTDERTPSEYRMRRVLFATKTENDYAPAPEQWIGTGLTGKQLARSVLQFDQTTGQPQIGLQFNDEGRKMFADITTRNAGKPVAIYLDGYPISVPTVNQPILDGQAVITGSFTIAEARLLVQRLNSGALPVPVTLVSQQTIGASLGNESIAKSLQAGYIGIGLVALFMIAYYRLPGAIAALALIIYSIINLAIYKTIPVTLTLSGIAGFILSLGMAVDANVLIFERLKEELKNGKPLQSAIKDGFIRAWPSIRDSHITTLCTAVVLFFFTTSLIKGFALTLVVGVLVNLFTSITVSRTLLLIISRWIKPLWLYGVKK